jgi:hypothetical protein
MGEDRSEEWELEGRESREEIVPIGVRLRGGRTGGRDG